MMVRGVIAASVCLALGACAVGPTYRPPPAPNDDRVTAQPLPHETAATGGNAGTAQTFSADLDVTDQWWVGFGSPAIDDLVARGLAHSPTVRAAQASLAAARELALAGRGVWWPAVDGGLDAGRERNNLAPTGDAAAQSLYNTFGARVAASYTVDLFGRERRLIESLDADETFAAQNLRSARLAIAADIVSTAISLASIEGQIETTRSLILAEHNTLTLVKKRLDLGHASLVEVLSQQAEYDATVATLPPLRAQRDSALDALATLIGATPATFSPQRLALEDLQLPAELPKSLPATIISRRPDVRAQEALVHSASAQIGVATANLLPQLTLTAYGGGQANTVGDVVSGPYSVWGIGTSLVQPIFRGGELRHRRRAAIDQYDAAVANYDSVVLGALRNAADVFSALVEDAELTSATNDEAATAVRALDLTERSFSAGGASYLQLLSAEQASQRAQINALRAQAARFIDTVSLYQALGGAP